MAGALASCLPGAASAPKTHNDITQTGILKSKRFRDAFFLFARLQPNIQAGLCHTYPGAFLPFFVIPLDS